MTDDRLSPAPVCFLDTETLGLEPDLHPIWEVGLIHPVAGELTWQLPVTARDVALADPYALKMTRFEERYQPDATTPFAQFFPAFLALTEHAHLVGAIVSFDEERLRRLAWRHGFQHGWHYHLIDVEAAAAGSLANSGGQFTSWRRPDGASRLAPPWESEELSRGVGVDPDRFDRHTALGDARWAEAMYEAIFDHAG